MSENAEMKVTKNSARDEALAKARANKPQAETHDEEYTVPDAKPDRAITPAEALEAQAQVRAQMPQKSAEEILAERQARPAAPEPTEEEIASPAKSLQGMSAFQASHLAKGPQVSPEAMPTLGRIVHYRESKKVWPAIVTVVNGDRIGIHVFTEGAATYRQKVRYSETDDTCWFWPPRI